MNVLNVLHQIARYGSFFLPSLSGFFDCKCTEVTKTVGAVLLHSSHSLTKHSGWKARMVDEVRSKGIWL